MDEILKKFLDQYEFVLKEIPNRILFYRDGVGEGQHEILFNEEVSKM